MKFNLLLFLLSGKLKGAAKRNPVFKEYIHGKTLQALIKTADNKQGRLYLFQDGSVSSVPGAEHDGVDCAMVWSDPDTAIRVMTSGNDEAWLAALTERKLVAQGSYKDFAWFTRALSKMSAS